LNEYPLPARCGYILFEHLYFDNIPGIVVSTTDGHSDHRIQQLKGPIESKPENCFLMLLFGA